MCQLVAGKEALIMFCWEKSIKPTRDEFDLAPSIAMAIESLRRLIQVSIEAFALVPGVIQVSFSRDLIYKAMGQNKHMIIRDIVFAETIIVELCF